MLLAMTHLPTPRSLRYRRAIKLAAVALFVLLTGGPTGIAGPNGRDDAVSFWFQQQQARDVQQAPGLVIPRPKPHFIREPRVVREPVREPVRHRPVHALPAAAPVAPATAPLATDTPLNPALAPVGPDAAPAGDLPNSLPAPAPFAPVPATTIPVLAMPAPVVPDKPVEASFFITVLGDNLGLLLFQGLQESLADKPQVAVRRKARESTGLVRDDFYDWLKVAHELTGGQERERIDFAVIMIGSNDRQPLRDGAASVDVRSDRWKEIYGQRVEELAAIFRDRKIPLVWVGLPAMRNERLSADVLFFNEIYKDRATRGGAIYVDTWEAFVDEKGQYNPYGPDVTGQNVKLRTGDGVHFTKAGALKLAHFAEADIRRAIAGTKAPAELAAVPALAAPAAPALPQTLPVTPPPAAEVPIDMTAVVSAQIRRETQGDASVSVQAALPPPDIPADLNFPLRPAAGPVVSLTAPPLAVGGQLATRGKRLASPLAGEAQASLDRAFAEGRAIDAKPGRADDFAWPRR